ncbi:hypothetical protein WR25_01249 isoform B [Diploscapter pachys]|uniref:Uncharacterized protein n=1 Tax=Diploscapter pachys TaxID=2018661 RepID=A0A2A2LXZ3_9BILA|nr:hypothetical protein WR25_01249 isoform B [Diploscapter pachys]
MQIRTFTVFLISSLFIVIEAAQPRVPHLKGELNSTGAEHHEGEHGNHQEYDPHRRHPHTVKKRSNEDKHSDENEMKFNEIGHHKRNAEDPHHEENEEYAVEEEEESPDAEHSEGGKENEIEEREKRVSRAGSSHKPRISNKVDKLDFETFMLSLG